MFLLWPDRPNIHRRRVRISVKAQLGAPPAPVSAVRVARRPVVHTIATAKTDLGRTGLVRVAAGADLPRAAAVVAGPAARATRQDVALPVKPVLASAVGSVAAVPGVRVGAASAVRLRPPRTLRRLFARSGGASFLGEGSPESELVAMLSSATLGAAARAARSVEACGLSADQTRFARLVGELALGQTPLSGFWGDSEVVDSLRLRLCRERGGAEPKTEARWESFLWWAGRRLGSVDSSTIPVDLVPSAAAALVSVHGARRTFELLLPHFSRTDAGPNALDTATRLTLRCALSGTFSPAMVRFLLPTRGGRSGKRAEMERVWEPALLALHAYRVAAHDAGLTHVTAAVVATIVRDQVREVGRRAVPHFEPRGWGSPPLTAEMEAAHREVVGSLGSLLTQHWWSYRRPWAEAACGPDVVAIERRLVRAVGDAGWPAHDVFLDDTLSLAACHALEGHTPSALATLAAAKTPAVFVPVRDRLLRALERGAFDRGAAPLVGSTLSREFQGVLDRLRHTPDPAEFGSPDWRRDDLRGRLLSRLQQQAPRGLALALRTVLGKAFADLDRFWLCPSLPNHGALAELAAWLDRQAPTVPSDADLIHFLETECRQTSA